MTDAASAYWTRPRIVAWAITAAVVAAAVGPAHIRAFFPPDRAYSDFIQEWLSARNAFHGKPIYRDLTESLHEHVHGAREGSDLPTSLAFTDPDTGAFIGEMKYNAHPPVAVLVTLPVAWLDYRYAHLAWNLITYALFLAAIAIAVKELGIPFRWPAIFPLSIVLLGNPFLNQIYQGQLNCLLAALVTVAWAADRRGHPILAGVAVGVAGAIKLYPLFLLGYFLFTRRWSGLCAGVAAFAAVNGIAATLFGFAAYREYIGAVVPSIAGQFEASRANLSIHGFWLRLFESEPLREFTGNAAPRLGRGLGWAAALAIVGVVARTGWFAATRDDRDRAFALAVVAMLLVSPITWSHYSLLLVLPVALVWARATSSGSLLALGAVVAILWLPPDFAMQAVSGREPDALRTVVDLGLVSWPHYALLGLFALVLRTGTAPSASDR